MPLPFVARNRRYRADGQRPSRPNRIVFLAVHVLRREVGTEVDDKRAAQLRHVWPRPLCPCVRLGSARQGAQPVPEGECRDIVGDGDLTLFRGRLRLRLQVGLGGLAAPLGLGSGAQEMELSPEQWPVDGGCRHLGSLGRRAAYRDYIRLLRRLRKVLTHSGQKSQSALIIIDYPWDGFLPVTAFRQSIFGQSPGFPVQT